MGTPEILQKSKGQILADIAHGGFRKPACRNNHIALIM